jgi:bifunctional non-homologous end joining protein LigD
MIDQPATSELPQYVPMQPTLVREPFHHPGWIYEEKVDGWRILAYKDGARVRLLSRNRVDHARRFRELAAAIAALPVPTLVLDGEVAIFDEYLRSRFDLLQHSDPGVVATPPVFITFDLLYRAGIDLSPRSLGWRRARLEEIVTGGELVFPVRRLPPNGLEAWATVLASGYEGMVGKDEASPYRGGITRSWLKVKVPGWTDPEDRWRRVRLDREERKA